jgi:hypothetical protein
MKEDKTGKIQRQKDIGYNLMDKYLGALAGLADVKPEVNMINITELETLARAATPGVYHDGIGYDTFIAAANPATMLKLIEVIRAQQEVIGAICKWEWNSLRGGPDSPGWEYALSDIKEARAALANANEVGVSDE